MPKINFNGKEYEVTVDGFGVQLIDGKTIDEFVDSLGEEDLAFAARLGMSVAKKDPEQFADIVERHELTELEPFIPPKKWKHQDCTIVTKFIRSGGYQQSVMWCNNHQEEVRTRSL